MHCVFHADSGNRTTASFEAKPGQETAVANFPAGALPLANAELGTISWFALRFGSGAAQHAAHDREGRSACGEKCLPGRATETRGANLPRESGHGLATEFRDDVLNK
jgi:hypothetical protein